MADASGVFLVVEPEMSGVPYGGTGTQAVSFDTWLGDDLVSAYPLLLVTEELRDRLQGLAGATGFAFSRVRATGSPFRRLRDPGRGLPAFWAVEIDGRPGRDDVGLTEAGALVVSRRVLDVLLEFRVAQATFAQYRPAGERTETAPAEAAAVL